MGTSPLRRSLGRWFAQPWCRPARYPGSLLWETNRWKKWNSRKGINLIVEIWSKVADSIPDSSGAGIHKFRKERSRPWTRNFGKGAEGKRHLCSKTGCSISFIKYSKIVDDREGEGQRERGGSSTSATALFMFSAVSLGFQPFLLRPKIKQFHRKRFNSNWTYIFIRKSNFETVTWVMLNALAIVFCRH